jgi:hypothetical protein
MRSTRRVRSISSYISGYIVRNRQAGWADGEQIARGVGEPPRRRGWRYLGFEGPAADELLRRMFIAHWSLFSIIYIMRLVSVSAI